MTEPDRMFQLEPQYPLRLEDLVDGQMKFKAGTLRAVRAFAKSKPWQGTQQERIRKLKRLVRDLSRVYGIPRPYLDATGVNEGDSDASFYIPVFHTITLRGRLSVLTLFFCFAHAMEKSDYQASRWAVNLFRKCFPQSWHRLRFCGHMAFAGRSAPM